MEIDSDSDSDHDNTDWCLLKTTKRKLFHIDEDSKQSGSIGSNKTILDIIDEEMVVEEEIKEQFTVSKFYKKTTCSC